MISTESEDAARQLVLKTVQWMRVQRIEDMAPISEKDFDILSELRDVLLRHGYEYRFGVCLLHKHFDLQPGEAALEETDEASRISTIRIVQESDCKGAMETAWQFSPDSEITAGRKCTIKCGGPGWTHTSRHECWAT